MPEDEHHKLAVTRTLQGDGWKLELLVSADKLTASVQLIKASSATACPPDQVVEFVQQAGLVLSQKEQEQLPGLAAVLTRGGRAAIATVAHGMAAGKWLDIDWFIPVGISHLRDYSDETIDLHEVSHFINVRAGQPLCQVPTAPDPGRDVFGQSLYPLPCPFQLGARVALDAKDLSRVIASEAGCIRFLKGVLSVEQTLDLAGDLNFRIGNIDFSGEVNIQGSVLDGFQIKSAKNVTIAGSVGSAIIEAGGSITIKGGVDGGHKGKLICAGNLQAHYLHRIEVESGGDVLVDIECHDCTVRALGSVTVIRGGIIGGLVQAAGSVSAGFIGSEMCVATQIQAGHDAATAESLEHPRKRLAHARERLHQLEAAAGPYLDKPAAAASLPFHKKMQVEQVQTRVDEARAALRLARRELLKQATQVPPGGAMVCSLKQVFPKVTVVIDSLCEEEIDTELSGPVKMAADRDQGAIKLLSGKPVTTPSVRAKTQAR
jgi:uncharacterized protein (DUF342 family)